MNLSKRLAGAWTALRGTGRPAIAPVSVGLDLMSIPRFERIARHPRGRRMVFGPAELAYADTLGEARRTEHLAGRFCAKEAVAKALGHGLGQDLGWRDIEITRDSLGAPGARLHGRAQRLAERQGVTDIVLSLSHQDGLAVCVAVAHGACGPLHNRRRTHD
ncbi:holo-ACP synthase [Streptomyces sp. OfavH-34-F]|uniref:holo-ACP synthase n=1 Tax=Streptomyces sp. OfavH-34-F TaxID=2917760 RepID=UPI001EF1B1B1|nr:holo-ACP synthase [Streptomyces sp. OfavH-34-F]MCG7524788.1 holo-ACP synthase [Streptomyces sp. OfavH-34-F]